MAAVDVGSNTVRLLVARPSARGGLRPLAFRLQTTRLGGGLAAGGRLGADAVDRSLSVLEDYVSEARSLGATWLVAVGTGALRDAADGRDFARLAEARTGLLLNIVDQRTEALLALAGAESVLGTGLDLALLDIGGRSTELVARDAGSPPWFRGLALGAVVLHERFSAPRPAGLATMRRELAADLSSADLPGSLPPGMRLAGTGGTFTTLASLDLRLAGYEPGRVNGHRLTLGRLGEILQELAGLDTAGRAALPGMEVGRADIIVEGAALAEALIGRLGRDEVVVCDASLPEGSLLAVLRGEPELRVTPLAG